MNTFKKLAGLFIVILIAWVWIVDRDLSNETHHRERLEARLTMNRLEHDVRFGSKPYFLFHHEHALTGPEHDSALRYLSHMTRREIYEIRNNITENVVLKGFLDTLLVFKDSLDQARGIYAALDN